MTFICTGTASGIPVADRRHASLVVRHEGAAMLFDAGEGVGAALREQEIDADALMAVYISHTHADHVAGLPLLLQGMHLGGRTLPLDLHIPPGRAQWFRQWFDGMYILEEKWSFPVHLRPIGDPVAPMRDVTVTPFPNRHLDRVRSLAAARGVPADSYSFRVDAPAGRAVISSDITAAAEVAEAAAGARLLFIDSTHVELDDILALAGRHPQLRIVCTHVPPELDLAAARHRIADSGDSAARIMFARDGRAFELEEER